MFYSHMDINFSLEKKEKKIVNLSCVGYYIKIDCLQNNVRLFIKISQILICTSLFEYFRSYPINKHEVAANYFI